MKQEILSDRILEEHKKIAQLIDEIEVDAQAGKPVQESLEQLLALLKGHFAYEEEQGSNESPRFARFSEALEELTKEHREMLGTLRRMIDSP